MVKATTHDLMTS